MAKKSGSIATWRAWVRANRLNLGGAGLLIAVVGVVATSFINPTTQAETYPPTTALGHVESYPDSRISASPIATEVQKHILEHVPVDGGERPGILLQYNCSDDDCASDLVSQLSELARSYPHVYLAPYPGMTPKVALTALGDMATFERFDRDGIVEFIERR